VDFNVEIIPRGRRGERHVGGDGRAHAAAGDGAPTIPAGEVVGRRVVERDVPKEVAGAGTPFDFDLSGDDAVGTGTGNGVSCVDHAGTAENFQHTTLHLDLVSGAAAPIRAPEFGQVPVVVGKRFPKADGRDDVQFDCDGLRRVESV